MVVLRTWPRDEERRHPCLIVLKSWEGPGSNSLESQPADFTDTENEATRGAGTHPEWPNELGFTTQVFSLLAKPCAPLPPP